MRNTIDALCYMVFKPKWLIYLPVFISIYYFLYSLRGFSAEFLGSSIDVKNTTILRKYYLKKLE